ncbi:MAG: glycosyltransferase family 2 protein [Thermodesulfobacteriota bacterium]
MEKFSVVIISFNAEEVIEECLDSASFADEILVVDSHSSDKTVEICSRMGARVISQSWLGFGRQKNLAVEQAEHDWVFVLDCDERISPPLASEIREILHNPGKQGYFVPRLNRWFGKNIKHCGLYPDYSIRLFDRRKGAFNEVAVHESVQLKGKSGYLKNPIHHLAYDTIEEFIDKQNRYSSLNHTFNPLKALLNPSWTFFRLYFLKLGFLDGWNGFLIARLYAQYTFWKYAKERE